MPAPGVPAAGVPAPGVPARRAPSAREPAPRARRRPTLLELSIWVGVAGTGIYAIGTGIAGMLNK
ncbi:hypothetical protein [Cryobacterium sinapicolor]|uniref:hypothetical protein n=1 Tax=Cryobacterium sinapicolor TaxID=1259236 RepID=UPI00187DF50C|nr:hypothetical protein [Cryobacterium sinapicolor]